MARAQKVRKRREKRRFWWPAPCLSNRSIQQRRAAEVLQAVFALVPFVGGEGAGACVLVGQGKRSHAGLFVEQSCMARMARQLYQAGLATRRIPTKGSRD